MKVILKAFGTFKKVYVAPIKEFGKKQGLSGQKEWKMIYQFMNLLR